MATLAQVRSKLKMKGCQCNPQVELDSVDGYMDAKMTHEEGCPLVGHVYRDN